MYNPVVQSLALAQHCALPILIVIANNNGYSAMRREHWQYYPDGVAAAKNIYVGHGVTGFDYAELVKPFGGYGRKVLLAPQPRPGAAGEQQVEPGAVSQQLTQRGRGLQQVLQVIDHHQQPRLAHRRRDRLLKRRAALSHAE